jgi:hypothetical protein
MLYLYCGTKFVFILKKGGYMNTTQAMIILTNGIRKYGTIIDGEFEGRIKFIPATDIIALEESQISNLIEHISIESIFSIDTYLK